MLADRFPPEFDPAIYRSLHADLWYLSDGELVEHFDAVGREAGRRAHPLPTRLAFRDVVAGAGSILEIGPFFRPMFRGTGVTYFDVLDRAGLERLARDLGRDAEDGIPEIDIVSPAGDLSVVSDQFDVVTSSHVIEHQPDLVGHLQQVERILRPGGCYVLFVPDKRYCFDHFLPESTIGDVIEAAIERRRFHSLRTLIDQQIYVTHNEPRRHWAGDHGRPGHLDADSVAAAMEAYSDGLDANRYVDRHAWQFTPDSFRSVVEMLGKLGMIGLSVARVYPTLVTSNEFWAVLSADRFEDRAA